MTTVFQLNENPDWHSAAQDLINGLQAFDDKEHKIRLLESLCDKLGDRLYPAFLQILFALEQFSDTEPKQLVAETLVECIRSGRLPSGRLSAWGSGSLTGDSAFGQTRVLGPIEYVCAWYAQGGNAQPLSLQQFNLIMTSLLSLVETNRTAKDFYCQKLQGDIDDPMSGALSNTTRQGLQELIEIWIQSDNISDAIDAFVSSLQSESLLNTISKGPIDHLT